MLNAAHIIVDDFGLSLLPGAQSFSSPDVRDIHEMRKRIAQQLRSPNAVPLVLVMPSNIFTRFADLEGQPGLKVEQISPRMHLRQRLNKPLPQWITDLLAVELINLAGDREIPGDDFIAQFLVIVAPSLLQASEPKALLEGLSNQSGLGKRLLALPPIRQRLYDLCTAIGITKAEELLRIYFNAYDKGFSQSNELGLMALRHRIETLMMRDRLHLETALPPRVCSQTLAESLPLLPVLEAESGPYSEYLCDLIKRVGHRISRSDIPAEALADYVLQDWPSLIETLQHLFEQNTRIATNSLIVALRCFGSELATDLAIRLREYLDHAHCDPLPLNASVSDVIRWSNRYFQYARGIFERNEQPDDGVCQDFARWVIKEQSRIIQSDYDWRTISRSVEELLAADTVVIFCMIDALSALHTDLIELELLERLPKNRDISIKPVFAPLPTITQVGKSAVLTGAFPNRTAVDYEQALRAKFQPYLGSSGLQVVKLWRTSREVLKPSTRLFVFLDNRIDDDLHQCTHFSHHRNRVRTAIHQLADAITGWQLDAARNQKECVVIITADHGATKVAKLGDVLPGTQPHEKRLLRLPSKPDATPEGFAYVPGKNEEYLIPYARVAFESAETMLHGGLTPEEVLIPFVLIGRGKPGLTEHLHLIAVEKRCVTAAVGWYVKLSLANTTNKSFHKLRIVTRPPFTGESPLFEVITPHGEIPEINVNINSEITQKGLTQVDFELRYQDAERNGYVRVPYQFDLDLAGRLLERTDAAKNFEDSFDL